jgi:hypothetical protein
MSEKKTRKMCLNMIVKNEAHIILETLNNIKKYIDYWVISDTGSTDGTQDLIIKFFKDANIDGKLVNHKWRDFGYNRTKALEACYDKSDYIWVIDADDIIVGDLIIPDNMVSDSYYLKYGSDFTYSRRQIFKNRGLKWVYRGILHEYPECINKKDTSVTSIEGNYYIDSRRLGARSKVTDKYERDAKLLAEQIERYPNDELINRYCFYAGQSYFDCKDYVNSIKYYKKRIYYGGWYEEVYYSYNRIAQCLMHLGKDENVVEKAYLDASNYLPSRAEPLCYLGEYFLLKNNYIKAHVYSGKALNIPYPKDQTLFIHKEVYDWKAKFTYVSSVIGLNKYREGYTLADTCHEKYVPEWQKFENLKTFCIPYIENEYTDYNKRKIDVICGYLASNKKNNVTFTITTCKRIELFEKTMNSFINCCYDILYIDKWILIDDNSSEEDRIKMKTLYPFFEFVFKTPEQEGHLFSMNLIRTLVKTPYHLYMEDDWKFIVKKNYIKPAIDILSKNNINPLVQIPADQNIENKKIAQVLFNKNYMEAHNRPVLGGYLAQNSNETKFLIHEHYKKDTKEYNDAVNKYKGLTNIFWPHYSFRPSIVLTKIYEELGEYSDTGEFERSYADKYYASNYISVFYDTFSCIHIGKKTQTVKTYTVNDYVFDNYIFHPNKDSYGHDIKHYPNKTIEELKILADNDNNCVAFNTYGYLKYKVNDNDSFIVLENKYYTNDGMYVKKT